MRGKATVAPYTKRNKRPHRYSDLLGRLMDVVTGGRGGEADRLRREHERMFGGFVPAHDGRRAPPARAPCLALSWRGSSSHSGSALSLVSLCLS